MSRTVVAATTIRDGKDVVVVCNDGAVFVSSGGPWRGWPAIPGTEADEATEDDESEPQGTVEVIDNPVDDLW